MNFKKNFNESGLKPRNNWVDQTSEFYNRILKSLLHGKVFNTQGRKICCCWEIYQNIEEKDIKEYDHSIKHLYIDHVDEIVEKYNSTFHTIIKNLPT